MSNLPDGMTDDAVPGFNDPEPQAEAAAPSLADEAIAVAERIERMGTVVFELHRGPYAELVSTALRYYAERERHAEDARIAAIVREPSDDERIAIGQHMNNPAHAEIRGRQACDKILLLSNSPARTPKARAEKLQ